MPYLTRASIDVPDLMARVAAPSRGGAVCFVGTVRAGPDDGDVVRIAYSGYEAMVEEEFARIIQEAEERWPGSALVAQHRLGDVPIGEASIAIVAAAPHRDDAFGACRYVIEEAKRRLPIWKREMFADGSAGWREHEPGATSSERTDLG
jgi:molybdopterin synthase catalytic subunit